MSSEGEEAQSEPESPCDASVYDSRAVGPLPPPDTAYREMPPSYGGSQQGYYRDRRRVVADAPERGSSMERQRRCSTSKMRPDQHHRFLGKAIRA
jgi:hypothetical protein